MRLPFEENKSDRQENVCEYGLFHESEGKAILPIKQFETDKKTGVYYKNKLIRFVKHHDQWWIIASDIAVVLNESIAKISEWVMDCYKDRITVQNEKGVLEKTIISLMGLCSIANTINTRNAEEFYRWVRSNIQSDIAGGAAKEAKESVVVFINNLLENIGYRLCKIDTEAYRYDGVSPKTKEKDRLIHSEIYLFIRPLYGAKKSLFEIALAVENAGFDIFLFKQYFQKDEVELWISLRKKRDSIVSDKK